MRRGLIAGNWKMHGSSAGIVSLLAELKPAVADLSVELAVIPPFVYVPLAVNLLADSPVRLGAQDVSQYAGQGAYTGEVAAGMLKDVGCHYVVVGHSERRELFAESDAVVAAKVAAVLEQGLCPILCVGETLAQREAGDTLSVVERQLSAVLSSVEQPLQSLVVAYEPVWAIGSGLTATPAQAQEVHAFIRDRLATADAALAREVRILYGGSVKADNAGELFAQPDIDGGLVGGASLDASEFAAIAKVLG